MSPRTPHALLCFFVSLGIGQAAEFDWSEHGTINLDTPPGWKVERKDGVGCSFEAQPESGVVARLQVSVVELPADQAVDAAALRERLKHSVQSFIASSVEREFRPVALPTPAGPGWYVELSDAALAGKPAVPDDFKVMRSALVLIHPHTLVIATMLLDDPTTPEAAAMLAMVSSLRLDPPAGSTPATHR